MEIVLDILPQNMNIDKKADEILPAISFTFFHRDIININPPIFTILITYTF